MLGEEPTYGINGRFGTPEKKFSATFTKTRATFYLSLDYNYDNGYFFNGKEMYKFKADNKNVNFPTQSLSKGFGTAESREVSLKGYVYNILANC